MIVCPETDWQSVQGAYIGLSGHSVGWLATLAQVRQSKRVPPPKRPADLAGLLPRLPVPGWANTGGVTTETADKPNWTFSGDF